MASQLIQVKFNIFQAFFASRLLNINSLSYLKHRHSSLLLCDVFCVKTVITTRVGGDRPAGWRQARGWADLKLGARGRTFLPRLLHARAEAAARVFRPVAELHAGKVAAGDVLVGVKRTQGWCQDFLGSSLAPYHKVCLSFWCNGNYEQSWYLKKVWRWQYEIVF